MKQVKNSTPVMRRKASTPEAREAQLINDAYDVAEQQMKNGTASSAIICHFLKLGSEKERTNQLKLRKEIALIDAKTKAIESSQRQEELFTEAITAMRIYTGQGSTKNED